MFASFSLAMITQDTRSHVVCELFDTEKSYVESLEFLVNVSEWMQAIYILYSKCKFHFGFIADTSILLFFLEVHETS